MTINGDEFDNYLYGGATKDVMNGLSGNDSLYGYGGNDTLSGGDDDDNLYGGDGSDKLNGGDGDDFMNGGQGDRLDGGSGVDVAQIDLSAFSNAQAIAVDFTGGVANDLGHNVSMKNAEILQLTTGNGNDTLTLDDTAVYGAATSNGYWYGGGGVDEIVVDWSLQHFRINAGTGSISVGSTTYYLNSIEKLTVTAGSGSDYLYGGTDNDVFHGNAGDDSLYGYGGNDTLDGGDGDDYIEAGTSSNSSGTDVVTGGDGDDTIYASSGDDIDGGAGSDALTLDLADHADAASFTIDGGNETILDASFSHIERLYLSTGSGDDTMTMTSGAIVSTDEYNEGAWNAGAGSDTINVDFSDQIFSVNANSSQFYIGDFIWYVSNVEHYNYTGGAGFDQMSGADVTDLLTGNNGNDTLSGFGGDDTLDGGNGRDQLNGGTGNDIERGGSGRDTINGDDGNDIINAGAGTDYVFGGVGNDSILGGSGMDEITGGVGADAIDGGADRDTIIITGVADSNSGGYDSVANFDFSVDYFRFTGHSISALEPTVGGGTLNAATFDADMEAKIGAAKLLANDAVIWTPTFGDLAGTWLIVDGNGTAGYQAGQDYVVQLVTPGNIGTADLSHLQG